MAVTATMGVGLLGVAAAAPLASASVSPTVSSASTVHAAAVPPITQTWTQTISDGSSPIAESSPSVATLADNQEAVLVGDRSDREYAFHLADGSASSGWAGGVNLGAPIDSTASVSGSGTGAIVYVGAGNSSASAAGGYAAINANGTERWFHTGQALPSGGSAGVSASLAVGNLQGGTDVVAGSMGQYESAFDGPSGSQLTGFPWFQADSSFSTPALANLSGSTDQIIEGGASTAGNAFNTQYSNGGHLRILSSTGNAGQSTPSGGLVCQYNTDEEVDSSPAIGLFGPGSSAAITFGTGTFYSGASTENQLLAVNTSCGKLWATTLDGHTSSSPALVDALGNGALQIAEGTTNGNGGGTTYLINGATGAVIWTAQATGEVIGSIVSADLSGSGYQDLLVPTTDGVQILDGKTGAQVGLLGNNIGFQNSPLVTDDPNGSIGITIAGYVSGGSIIDHYEVQGSNGATVNESGAWPMFHHDPQLTGNAGGISPPSIEVACNAPAGGPQGYLETASDGGIFTFGNLPFCGSTGSITLNKPIVGSEVTSDGGGYWMVASDGGIFSFGDAAFYGSTGSIKLNEPIVGMATTPDGKGYWLVASDGGIFSFGDAKFYGSTGGTHLNAPIVGMAATPDGKGYWLVASDGGIFTFGDATFKGSTGGIHLNKPIVGMATDTATGGYWLVASDGGIFSFGGAPFDGSTGGIALNKPIVGMEASPNGGGYRLVASDGGIFDFGNATFDGSEGGKPLNQPVVTIAGF
jgi:hypothetical protein